MSITASQALKRYGPPEKRSSIVLLQLSSVFPASAIPHHIYCNRDTKTPLEVAFRLLRERGLLGLIKTWDGCFNIRRVRGGVSMSLHSWGLAVDINAAWNRMGKKSTQDPRLVACFKEAGFEWGGDWRFKDAMHFQLAKLP